MEISGGLKKRWRRSYQRLDGAGKEARVIRLGGKSKRSWRIRGIRKLKLRFSFVSPIKVLAKLRDAYVNMMLGLEREGGAALQGDNFFGIRKIAAPNSKKFGSSKGDSKAEQCEAKLIFEIYMALKASREGELASQ